MSTLLTVSGQNVVLLALFVLRPGEGASRCARGRIQVEAHELVERDVAVVKRGGQTGELGILL